MNKAWVWLAVLVVVIGIVAYFATRGGEEGDEGGAVAGMMQIDESNLKFGERVYDNLCAVLTRMSSLEMAGRAISEQMQRVAAVVGYGTVLTVDEPQPGLLSFEVDVDPPDGQVEVRVEVKADKYTGEAPSAGQYVRYEGRVADWKWHAETGKIELWLEKGYVSPAKGK